MLKQYERTALAVQLSPDPTHSPYVDHEVVVAEATPVEDNLMIKRYGYDYLSAMSLCLARTASAAAFRLASSSSSSSVSTTRRTPSRPISACTPR